MVGRRRGTLLWEDQPVYPGTPDTKSLDLTITEYLQEVNQTISIANEWSIVFWRKPLTAIINVKWFELDQGTNQNVIKIGPYGPADPYFEIQLYDSSGTEFKRYRWSSSFLALGVWAFVAVTWDGTNLKFYPNGTETAASSKTIDDSGTMTDGTRTTLIGPPSNSFSGRAHSTAIFNVVLDQANITQIYRGRGSFDLRQNYQEYNQASNLKHYWRHGFNASDIGEDLGFGSPKIDVGDNAVDVTADDIVTDAP